MKQKNVFISYSHLDRHWVLNQLLPHLKKAGLTICIDKEDFEFGVPIFINIEQAVENSRHTLVVMTPNWLTSEWAQFETLLVQTTDPASRWRRLIPLMLKPTELPGRLKGLTYADFTQPASQEETMARLLHQLKGLVPQNVTLSTDGNMTQAGSQLSPPLPSFDPEWLKNLDEPGGAIRFESPFYIEREVDAQAKALLLQEGRTIRIKGSRQMGKTSLLARLYQHAHDNNLSSIYIDFQQLDDDQFVNLETLLRNLADLIADELQPNHSPDDYWQGPLGPKDKFSRFLLREVLESVENRFILIMDEVDRVFAFAEYRNDFFSLIRSWHNKRAFNKSWKKLNLVLGYSTEASMFITDVHQSPFNIGTELGFGDFDHPQVEELNRLHNRPIKMGQEMDSVMELLHGHPFLVRKALYDLVTRALSLDQWMERVYDEDGPFAEHLHHYLWRLQERPDLSAAMKSVIQAHTCPTDALFYQLQSAGLVKGSSRNKVMPRCGLYARYFGRHL